MAMRAKFPDQRGPRNRLSRAAGAAPPPAGSVVREATSVGATNAAPGRPKRSSAPPGGSVVREATSVGAIYLPSLSQLLDARIKRSRSRLALAAAVASMLAGKRIIQLPSGSTT